MSKTGGADVMKVWGKFLDWLLGPACSLGHRPADDNCRRMDAELAQMRARHEATMAAERDSLRLWTDAFEAQGRADTLYFATRRREAGLPLSRAQREAIEAEDARRASRNHDTRENGA